MPTLKITDDSVIMRKDGETLYVNRFADPNAYNEAREAALRADFDEIERLALFGSDDFDPAPVWDDVNEADEDPCGEEYTFNTLEDILSYMRDVIDDGIVTADMLGIDATANHEHDLSQWNGSPIFYPTKEMAMAQHERWPMFWDFHDFGPEAPNGYRYATVPTGIGPYAPEGYDWVCLRREDRYK